MRDPALAARLAAFSIDEGAPALTFSARLARENRWSLTHAEHVVGEYLRFVYLASVSRETLTPSVAVDQAWHLHLCYTRSYWHHLCRETLGRELHHGPTRGGATENTRYHECYDRTLHLYEEEFGTPPPANIWPSAARRFAADAAPVSIAPAEHFIVPKLILRRGALAAVLVPTAALGLGAAVQTDMSAASLLFVVLFFAAIIALIIVAIRAVLGPRRKNNHDRSGSGCSTGACGHGTSRHDSSDGGGDSGCGGSGCGSGCGGGGD